METVARSTPAAEAVGLLEELSSCWDAPGLARAVRVTFSARLTHNFGHCKADTGDITIASRIVSHPDVLAEVITHEAAHVEVWRRHAAHAASHGPEWRALMVAAGFVPRRCLPPLPGDPPSGRRAGHAYLHRCPVCAAQRMGGRPVRRWRCVACHAAGRGGLLEIIRVNR
jgi:predicted SprT family Zn-dependent metalloprotease